MPVSITIKNLPEETVERLRERAKLNYRSLQAELRRILDEAAQPRNLTLDEVYQRAQASGLRTESSVEMIRTMRDERYGGGLTVDEAYERAQAIGLQTESSVDIIRKMRDERYGR